MFFILQKIDFLLEDRLFSFRKMIQSYFYSTLFITFLIIILAFLVSRITRVYFRWILSRLLSNGQANLFEAPQRRIHSLVLTWLHYYNISILQHHHSQPQVFYNGNPRCFPHKKARREKRKGGEGVINLKERELLLPPNTISRLDPPRTPAFNLYLPPLKPFDAGG